jgi:crotonobetainyl-CoA:carnitine CoA-transferase CaiB-like acyl-CoA transferase
MTATHPLSGIRVLELANYIAGPYCGTLLADLGAEVIKIENPRGGDFSRATGPFVGGESAGFLALNRNKTSVTLDLKHPRGKELLLELAKTADVLIENFRPGTMAGLGLDYAPVSMANPRLIYCSASGFGQTGPYSQRAALDLIVQGMSGLMSITGEPDRPPVKVGVPIADFSAALFGAYAILGALLARDQTGRGQYIDISLLESAMALEVWETSGYFATGDVPGPLGSAHRVSAPYQALRTSDGYITLGATTPGNWAALCAALGLQHLEHDPRFASVAHRRARYQELAALLEAVTTTQPSEHWYRLLERAGVPCGVLERIDQAISDEQVQARGFIVELPHSTIGSVRATGSPVHLSETPVRLERSARSAGARSPSSSGAGGRSCSRCWCTRASRCCVRGPHHHPRVPAVPDPRRPARRGAPGGAGTDRPRRCPGAGLGAAGTEHAGHGRAAQRAHAAARHLGLQLEGHGRQLDAPSPASCCCTTARWSGCRAS